MPSLFHGAKDAQYSGPNLFADGGEVSEEALKAEGMKASEGEKVGFFERLKMGNIDDPESEAYRRFGAGRAKEMRMSAAEDARDAELTRNYNAMADRQSRESEFDAAEKQMDSLDALKKSAPAPAPVAKAAPRTAPKAAPKATSKPVDYSSAPDESSAETARLAAAARSAAERKEVPRANMVSPRPRMNFSTPADRARWDEKYGKTHNADGMPK